MWKFCRTIGQVMLHSQEICTIFSCGNEKGCNRGRPCNLLWTTWRPVPDWSLLYPSSLQYEETACFSLLARQATGPSDGKLVKLKNNQEYFHHMYVVTTSFGELKIVMTYTQVMIILTLNHRHLTIFQLHHYIKSFLHLGPRCIQHYTMTFLLHLSCKMVWHGPVSTFLWHKLH